MSIRSVDRCPMVRYNVRLVLCIGSMVSLCASDIRGVSSYFIIYVNRASTNYREINLADSLRGPIGEMTRWITREGGRGTVVTSDMVWNRIKMKYKYLDEKQQEALFQAAEDSRV